MKYFEAMIQNVREGFLKNPAAWILFGLFLLAEYHNYKKGIDIARICELTGPHDASTKNPRTNKEELDTICLGYQPDE